MLFGVPQEDIDRPDVTAVYDALVELLGGICGINSAELRPGLPVIRLGIDPMMSDEIIARAKSVLKVEIDFPRIAARWLELTLADLAAELATGKVDKAADEPIAAVSPTALTPPNACSRAGPDDELGRLGSAQAAALSNVRERCLPRVPGARKSLLASLPSSTADLDHVVDYLRRQARVTIQFHPDQRLPSGASIVDSFIADPVYKNQFQTLVSSGSYAPMAGSSRDAWERELFAGAYHDHPLIAEERPRYGALSALGLPPGNGEYGRCFFELRQDVKPRTTFCPTNSSQCGAGQVSTADTLEVLLELIAAIDVEYARQIAHVALGGRPDRDRHYRGSFVEVQIHGPVELRRDVEHLVIDVEYTATHYGDKLLELADRIDATVRYTDHDPRPV